MNGYPCTRPRLRNVFKNTYYPCSTLYPGDGVELGNINGFEMCGKYHDVRSTWECSSGTRLGTWTDGTQYCY
jgi:hypothetical protein